MQSTWNLDRIILLIKEMFPANFIEIRHGEDTFGNFVNISTISGLIWGANFRKVPSPCRILMKFTGNISFINSMILSKFQVDCITLADFRIFIYIGKFDIFQYFWLRNSMYITWILHKFHFFCPFWCHGIIIQWKKWVQACFEDMTFIPPTSITRTLVYWCKCQVVQMLVSVVEPKGLETVRMKGDRTCQMDVSPTIVGNRVVSCRDSLHQSGDTHVPPWDALLIRKLEIWASSSFSSKRCLEVF